MLVISRLDAEATDEARGVARLDPVLHAVVEDVAAARVRVAVDVAALAWSAG